MQASPPIVDVVRGDATGLPIPAHHAAFVAAGADFLTRAFRAFGSLAPDNAVARITAIAPCPGGSTGSKLFVTLDYARPEPGLRTELFVKFSRDFTDARRDWQRHEMESEARFAALSRLPGFPIRVPEPYFADYHAGTGTGLVITERVAFGEGGIEPHRRKCMDHRTLADPLEHYHAMVGALARLAAAHKAGRLAADLDRRFPFDPVSGSADPIRDDAAAIRARIAGYADFALRAPQLLPPAIRTPDFIARMERDALRVLEHHTAIQRYLTGNPDLIALCHWNAHIDNGWFRRDADGALQCGLIDWGRVGQITLGSALWGCLSAAHHDIWDRHLGTLLAHFASVYHAEGGPPITVAALERHLALHMAAMGVARMLVFPEVILHRLPEAVDAAGPQDAMFDAVDPARNCLHILTVFLKYWQRRDFGRQIDRLLAG